MHSVTGTGRVVAGRYLLRERVGHGSTGTVWRAQDLQLRHDVAVKEVRPGRPMSERDRRVQHQRSLREARVAARLSHPGVVAVHDVIEAEGSPWVVMEFVPGQSLAQALAAGGPLPPGRAAGIGRMLLGALASAHAAGIVHRDVKPANVLLASCGRVVLTDFGMAICDGDPRLTQAGMVMGTPGFCAPERIQGGPATPASDLWSLGATLYAAVTGRGPFDGRGTPMAVLASIVHNEPPSLPAAVPLNWVIMSLMSRDPAERPDAAAAGRMLDDAAGDDGAPSQPRAGMVWAQTAAGRHRRVLSPRG